MGKQKKNHPQKPKINPADKRPWQLIFLLILLGIGTFAILRLWLFYTMNNIVGGSSVPVPPSAIPAYRIFLLVCGLLAIGLWLLLFFGTKVGFWLAAIGYGINILIELFSLDLLGALFNGFALYCIVCESTRIYFRIGQFKAFGPRGK